MLRNIFKVTSIQYMPRRLAGHSKWANIKHAKALKDGQRSKLFLKLGQRITVAIKEAGNANPESNLHLAQAIEMAKKQNMPVASIQNVIKSAQADKSNLQPYWLEVKGPAGCFIIIQALTNNPKKTKMTIAPILKKHKALFVDRACKHLFLHKGEIIAVPPPDVGNIEETVVDHAIECGAEEVYSDDETKGTYKFTCEPNSLKLVNSKLQVLKYDIKSSDFNFIPNVKVTLSDEDIETISKLIDKLGEHPDVVELYDNVA